LLPGILTQLGSEGLSHLKRLANNVVGSKILSSVEEGKEEDIPDLVENFENVANSEAQEKKAEEIATATIEEAAKPQPTPATAPPAAEEKKETKKETTPKKSANEKGGKKQQSKDKKA
jgi:hypothetical protein